ncbi:MAG: hypothetical protein AAF517_11925 [Planctomycetota bacterium]
MGFQRDRTAWVVFAILVAMCVTLVAAWVIVPEPQREVSAVLLDGKVATIRVPAGHGVPHPDHKGMLRGGDGAARHSRLVPFAWVFGSLQVLFFGVCVATSLREGGRAVRWGVRLSTVLGVVVMSAISWTYLSSLETPPGSVLGVPVPAAWFIFGIWLFPCGFAFVFWWQFQRAYVDDETLAKFERIVERGRNS